MKKTSFLELFQHCSTNTEQFSESVETRAKSLTTGEPGSVAREKVFFCLFLKKHKKFRIYYKIRRRFHQEFYFLLVISNQLESLLVC